MNKEKKTLLNIRLLLQYYKNNNILDRYHRIIESGIVFDNEILDEIQPNIYIVKYNKYIKLKKEVDRLNNIINEAKEECKSVIEDSEHTTVSEFNINGLMRTILKILNKGDSNE